MERLTYKDEFGRWTADVHYGGVVEHLRDVPIARLAAYEDTGLEPEDLKKVFNEEAVLKLAAQALGTTPERLRELVKAQKEGRVAVSFDTGDTVWIIERDEDGEACEVSGYVFLTETAGYAFVSSTVNGSSDVKDILADAVERTAWDYHADFGVYPITDCYKTRAEAEAALGGGGDGT